MDEDRAAQCAQASALLTLEEVPAFVLEQPADAKSGSDEEGLDDVMDERARRRLSRASTASEVR